MLFTQEETTNTVGKFASGLPIVLEPGILECLQAVTNGHPGMVGSTLQHIEKLFKEVGPC